MNRSKTLSNLQSKPEGVRRRLAYFSALFIGFIIFIVWLATDSSSIYENSQTPTPTEDSIASPLKVIGQEINFASQEISKGFKLLKENFRNTF